MEQTKDDNFIKVWCGWKRITSQGFVEVWMTPTKYLTCYKYGGIFIFSSSLDEAKRNIEECKKRARVN